jgi:hypothetical protein
MCRLRPFIQANLRGVAAFLLGMTGWSTLICRPQLKSCSQGMWWNKSKRVQAANNRQTKPWRVGTLCMNPSFKVRGAVLVLHPLDMVSVALDQLGECLGSLAENGQEIVDALDELLTRSWQ